MRIANATKANGEKNEGKHKENDTQSSTKFQMNAANLLFNISVHGCMWEETFDEQTISSFHLSMWKPQRKSETVNIATIFLNFMVLI